MRARTVDRQNGRPPLSLIAHARVVVRHAAGYTVYGAKMIFPFACLFRAPLDSDDFAKKIVRRAVGIFRPRGNECVIKSSRGGHRQDSICGRAPAELQRPAVNKACNARRTRTSLFARVHHPISRSLAAFVSVPPVPLFRRIPAFIRWPDNESCAPAPPRTDGGEGDVQKRNKRPVKKYDGFQVRLTASRTLSTGTLLLTPGDSLFLVLLPLPLRPSPSITLFFPPPPPATLVYVSFSFSRSLKRAID